MTFHLPSVPVPLAGLQVSSESTSRCPTKRSARPTAQLWHFHQFSLHVTSTPHPRHAVAPLPPSYLNFDTNQASAIEGCLRFSAPHSHINSGRPASRLSQ